MVFCLFLGYYFINSVAFCAYLYPHRIIIHFAKGPKALCKIIIILCLARCVAHGYGRELNVRQLGKWTRAPSPWPFAQLPHLFLSLPSHIKNSLSRARTRIWIWAQIIITDMGLQVWAHRILHLGQFVAQIWAYRYGYAFYRLVKIRWLNKAYRYGH